MNVTDAFIKWLFDAYGIEFTGDVTRSPYWQPFLAGFDKAREGVRRW